MNKFTKNKNKSYLEKVIKTDYLIFTAFKYFIWDISKMSHVQSIHGKELKINEDIYSKKMKIYTSQLLWLEVGKIFQLNTAFVMFGFIHERSTWNLSYIFLFLYQHFRVCHHFRRCFFYFFYIFFLRRSFIFFFHLCT